MKKYSAFWLFTIILFCGNAFAAVPAISSFSIENNAVFTNKDKPTLSIDATDANALSFSCDGANFTKQVAYAASYSDFNFNSSENGCSVSDGNRLIYVKAHSTDFQEAIANDSIILDTAKPVLGADANSFWQATDANIHISCTDSLSGCNNLKINGSDYSFTDQNKYYYLVSGDGNNAVALQVFDKAGNSKEKTIFVLIDKTGPALNNTSPATDTNKTRPLISFDVNDSGSGYKSLALAVDGNSVSPTITVFGKNAHVSYTLPYDANNRSIRVDLNTWDNMDYNLLNQGWTFNIDTIGPENPNARINSNNAYTNSTSATINLDLISASECGFRNNSSDAWNFSGFSTSMSWTLSSGDGTKNVYVLCRDIAGNYSQESSDSIVLDTVAPTAPNAPDVSVGDDQATLSWNTVSDNSGGSGIKEYKAYVNGNFNSSATGNSIQITGLSNGTEYNFKIGAIDNAGNEAISSLSYGTPVDSGNDNSNNNNNNNNNNTNDATLPVLNWLSPASNATVSGIVTLEVEATDIGTGIGFVLFKLPDSNYVYADFPVEGTNKYRVKWVTWNLENGTSYEITATAQDKASPNNNKRTKTRSFTVDNTQAFQEQNKDDADNAIKSAEDAKDSFEAFLNELTSIACSLGAESSSEKNSADSLLSGAKADFSAGDYSDAKENAENALAKYQNLIFSISVSSYGQTQNYPFSIEKVPVFLSALGFDTGTINECVSLMDTIKVERHFEIRKITDNDSAYYKAVIEITLENTGSETEEIKVIEIIPKEFAETASQISSADSFTVIEEDPKIEFVVSVPALASRTIVYALKEDLTKTQADKMTEDTPLDYFISSPVILSTGSAFGTGTGTTALFSFGAFDPVAIGGIIAIIAIIIIAAFLFINYRNKEGSGTEWGAKENKGFFDRIKTSMPKGSEKPDQGKWRFKGN